MGFPSTLLLSWSEKLLPSAKAHIQTPPQRTSVFSLQRSQSQLAEGTSRRAQALNSDPGVVAHTAQSVMKTFLISSDSYTYTHTHTHLYPLELTFFVNVLRSMDESIIYTHVHISETIPVEGFIWVTEKGIFL